MDQDALQNTITSEMKAIKHDGTIAVSAASAGLTSSNIEVDVTAGSDADLRAASEALIKKVSTVKGGVERHEQPVCLAALHRRRC